MNLNLFYALRPKHWIKNLFVLMPLIFSEKLFEFPNNLNSVMAFVLFSMMSSAAYLINDVMDIDFDRMHQKKQLRPIASGKVSKDVAIVFAIILAIVSFFLSFLLHRPLGWILMSYFVMNLIYSKFLKQVVIIDVFTIGLFFITRVLVGSVAIGVELSHWMVFMVFLLALFLGFEKRRQEIMQTKEAAMTQRPVLKQYNLHFLDQMIVILTTSMIVVYMLYTIDERTISLLGTNRLIYTIPFVYYGIFRYFYLVHKEKLGEDPVLILLSDRVLQLNALLWIWVCVISIYF